MPSLNFRAETFADYYYYFFKFESYCVIIILHLEIRKELLSSWPQLLCWFRYYHLLLWCVFQMFLFSFKLYLFATKEDTLDFLFFLHQDKSNTFKINCTWSQAKQSTFPWFWTPHGLQENVLTYCHILDPTITSLEKTVWYKFKI